MSKVRVLAIGVFKDETTCFDCVKKIECCKTNDR